MTDLRDLHEVMPEEADGGVGELYDDIREVLHVPFVNYLFRVLASDPPALERTWTGVRPWLLTRAFEERADELRDAAAPDEDPEPLDLAAHAPGDARRIAAFDAAVHGVLPKLLLVATGMVEGAPAGPTPEPEREPGVPGDAESIPMVSVDEAEGRLAERFEEIRERHGHPGVASWYRALGHWPGLLEEIWSRLAPRVGSPDYLRRREALADRATEAWRSFGEERRPVVEDAEVEAAIEIFRNTLIPDLLMDVAYVHAATAARPASAR